VADPVEARCAVVQSADNVVVNIIVALPSDPVPDGCFLVEVMNGQDCNMGWVYDGANFVAPSAG